MSSSTSFFCYVKRRQETEWVISFCQEENIEYGYRECGGSWYFVGIGNFAYKVKKFYTLSPVK